MGLKKKAQPTANTHLARKQALACIPLANPEIKIKTKEEGILLEYEVEVKPWFRGIFKWTTGKESNIITKKLQLDAIGSAVWSMIDGKLSVKEIIDLFQRQHQLEPREAEISITHFFKDLGNRGLLAMKPEETSTTSK